MTAMFKLCSHWSIKRHMARASLLCVFTVAGLIALPGSVPVVQAQAVTARVQVEGEVRSIAVNQTTNKVYMVLGDDRVHVMEGSTDSIEKTISMGNNLRTIAVNERTNKAYAVDAAVTAAGGNTVFVLDCVTNTLIRTIAVGEGPSYNWGGDSAAVNPITNKVYVANYWDHSISVIDSTSDDVVATVSLGESPPFAIALNPTTNNIYAVCDDKIIVINGATDSVTTAIPDPGTSAIAVNAATNMIFALSSKGGSNTLDFIDGATNTVIHSRPTHLSGGQLGAYTNKNRLYVAMPSYVDAKVLPNNTVEVWDAASGSYMESLQAYFPKCVAFNNSTSKVYVGGGCVTVIYDPFPSATSRTWGTGSVGSPQPATTWYLPEGCTAGGFETWILVQSLRDGYQPVVKLTYMTPSGEVEGPELHMTTDSRASFSVGATVPDNWSVSTRVTSSAPVVVERSTYTQKREGATSSIGVPSPSKTWYLAEGTTGPGFETWLLLQNPGSIAADVHVQFMTERGPKAGPDITVNPGSRATINAADFVPNEYHVSTHLSSENPIVAERAVYWNNRKGATSSIGASVPQKKWYFAEGCTAQGFETWILLMNPQDRVANVDITYRNENGAINGPTVEIPPRSRKTVSIADTVADDVSVSTEVLADQPVVAERAVYWGDRTEGHDSIGSTSPSTTWYLPEGSTGPGFETWVLVQNPNSAPAEVTLDYMTSHGPVYGRTVTIPPNSRMTFNAGDTVAYTDSVATYVAGSIPVVAEKAVYGDAR